MSYKRLRLDLPVHSPAIRASITLFHHNQGMDQMREPLGRYEMPAAQVSVVVAAGWDEIAVARAALTPFQSELIDDGSGSLVIAWGDAQVADSHKGLADVVLKEIGSSFATVSSVAPTAIPLTGWVRSPRSIDPWAAVDVDDRSDRLQKAWLRQELVDASAVIAVNRIPAGESRDPLVLGLWARFAHPRQRLGALAGDDRTGLRAELATAVKPALCILCGESRERQLVVATRDQIAAELTGRAIQFLSQPDPYGERPGPWELPLIQRATELDLGARLPSDLSFKAVWAGGPGEPGERMLQATVEQICLALGVPLA
jgi:hypothetical protein